MLDIILWIGAWSNQVRFGIWDDVHVSVFFMFGCYLFIWLAYRSTKVKTMEHAKHSENTFPHQVFIKTDKE